MEKFTQGEWQFAQRNAHEITTTFVGVKIGNEYIDIGFYNDGKDRANAHLIAAAPDMYRVLKKLSQPYGREDVSDEEIETVLAKADGEV